MFVPLQGRFNQGPTSTQDLCTDIDSKDDRYMKDTPLYMHVSIHLTAGSFGQPTPPIILISRLGILVPIIREGTKVGHPSLDSIAAGLSEVCFGIFY